MILCTSCLEAQQVEGVVLVKRIADDQWEAYVQGDELPADDSQPAPLESQVIESVQARLDAFAQTRGYDNILSACTYAVSTVAKFKSEGQCCVDLRDECWATCYQILGDVQAGNRPMPTLDEVIAALPSMEWPQ